MFKELHALIPDKGSIRFALTRTGPDTMAVVLVPEFPASLGEAPKLTPLSVSGPVDELEAGFLEAVLAYAPEVAKLENNLVQAQASMEAKKAKPAAKAEPKPAAPAAPAPAKPTPPPQASMFAAAEASAEAPAAQNPQQEGEDHDA